MARGLFSLFSLSLQGPTLPQRFTNAYCFSIGAEYLIKSSYFFFSPRNIPLFLNFLFCIAATIYPFFWYLNSDIPLRNKLSSSPVQAYCFLYTPLLYLRDFSYSWIVFLLSSSLVKSTFHATCSAVEKKLNSFEHKVGNVWVPEALKDQEKIPRDKVQSGNYMLALYSTRVFRLGIASLFLITVSS